MTLDRLDRILFGKLGLSVVEANMMSFRDTWNAIEGYTDAKKQEYAVLFDIASYNASRTASHNNQLKQIRRDRNPYKENKAKPQGASSFDDMVPFLRGLTGKA